MTTSDQVRKIVDGGYCIGCGVCKVVESSITMKFDQYGQYQAHFGTPSEISYSRVLNVCPFSNKGPNEDQIGASMFGGDCLHDKRLGYFHTLYIGHVVEGVFREKGTSGGIISWVATELLEQGLVDHILHVKKADRVREGRLLKYDISSTPSEIMEGAKSRYYPVELSEVLSLVKETPGRYALVGLPCFIKAVRRLMLIDPILNERIVFCIGLVCGHLKSNAFADCFAWQVGINPGKLEEVDFRVKFSDRTAGDYGVYLRGEGKEIVRPTREFIGSNWGHNFFRYSACDYCDDVFAETADISVGDAWLPKYEKDPKGTSVVVVRNSLLHGLIESSIETGSLHLVPSTPDKIAESQAGGLRDRREGLAYRLYLRRKEKKWAPQKRVEPSKVGIPYRRRKIYQNRSKMRAASHQFWKNAMCNNSFELFSKEMQKLITRNQRYYQSLIRRCLGFLKRISTIFVPKS